LQELRPLLRVLSDFEIDTPSDLSATDWIVLYSGERKHLRDLLEFVPAQIQVEESYFVLKTFCRLLKVRPYLSTVETNICIKENKSRQVLVSFTLLKLDELFCVQGYDISVVSFFGTWVLLKLGG